MKKTRKPTATQVREEKQLRHLVLANHKIRERIDKLMEQNLILSLRIVSSTGKTLRDLKVSNQKIREQIEKLRQRKLILSLEILSFQDEQS